MGTYDDESPDASVGERLANSIGKIARSVTGYTGKPSVTANKSEEDQLREVSGDDSKIGRMKAAQSTDRDNSYSY